jgi:transposase
VFLYYYTTNSISKLTGVESAYEIPDLLWQRIVRLLPPLPPLKKKKRSGRPRMDDRKAIGAIFYVLRTGCQCKALPRSIDASSTVHDRFQEWLKADVFTKMWVDGLLEYDRKDMLIGDGRPLTPHTPPETQADVIPIL